MKFKLLFIYLIFLSVQSYGQQDVDYFLIARNTGKKVLANNDTIRVFGFAESLGEQPGVPGPTIFANEGDSVHIDLWNVSQGAPHTIHLHGLDVDQENDGVPHLSFDVPHLEHGYYHFKAPHAGTYLYHCHVVSTIHVQAGMYGLIIIRPSDGSNTTWNGGFLYENEHSYFLSEIDTVWHRDSILLHDHDTSNEAHQVEIPKYGPQFFLINGLSDIQLEEENIHFNSSVNQVDYIRLANIGYFGTRIIFPSGLNSKIISSDGRPITNIEISDTVTVFPGERYGVLTKANEELVGMIRFEYFDLNTNQVKSTQVVPVEISGFSAIEGPQQNSFSFKVRPNPCNEYTSIDFELINKQEVHISILGIDGTLILEKPMQLLNSGLHTVPIGEYLLNTGVYVVRLNIEGIGSYSQLIVK